MDEKFLKALLEKFARLQVWLRDERKARLFFTLLILGFALLYYGSYYRHDLRFRDEGGTVALGAQRLLNGERPIVDVTLNYNVLWFYPVVALFKWFGVNFVLMRAWFLALSAVAALIAFFAVNRAGRQPWIAFAVALLCVLVPGMIFKNYIPLLVIANSSLLMRAALTAPRTDRSFYLVAAGGVLVGITFLIRIDLGLFFTALWLGLHFLRMFDRTVPLLRKIPAMLSGFALTIGLAWLVHQPVVMDARARGFEPQFTAQYRGWAQMIENGLRSKVGLRARKYTARQARPERAADTPIFWNTDILKRNAWNDFAKATDWETRALVPLTYLPILTIAGLLAWTFAGLARGLRTTEPEAWRKPLAALVLLGGALTAFPQFFFFRPDAPHVSEFSPGYWVAVTGVVLLLSSSKLLTRIFLGLLAAHAALYLSCMMPNRWTGTIAARQYHHTRFTAANGVDVFVSANELPALQALCKVVAENSKPGEYLVAYPYHPTINVMTDRPTYEKDVYIDNSTRTRRWDDEAIKRFEKFQPAVIVLSDWAVNGHDGSRFSGWAAPTKKWVAANYESRGTFKTDVDEFEVFTRPTTKSPP
ncbi:MAG: hypothetical protein ABIZ56_02250 [Chthoniobacteraceae bacterium]